MLSGLLLVMALGAASPEDGAGAPVEASSALARQVVTPPAWRRAPTHGETERFYPRLAMMIGLEGYVLLQCDVRLDGALADCLVERETPRAFGFGDAALKLAPLVNMTPGKIDGTPVDRAKVKVPFLFSPPMGAMPDMPGSLRCYGRLTAFVRGNPIDWRAEAAAEVARRRSETLMTNAGLSPDEKAGRLAAAIAAEPEALQGSKITNGCFKAFLE